MHSDRPLHKTQDQQLANKKRLRLEPTFRQGDSSSLEQQLHLLAICIRGIPKVCTFSTINLEQAYMIDIEMSRDLILMAIVHASLLSVECTVNPRYSKVNGTANKFDISSNSIKVTAP